MPLQWVSNMSHKALANIHAGRLISAGEIITDSEFNALPGWVKISFQSITSQPKAPSAAPQTLKADDEHPSAGRVSSAAGEETEVVTDNPDRQYMNKKKKKR